MKKRIIVCFLISIYLIYSHKNRLLINLKEIPYLLEIYTLFSNMFETPEVFSHIPGTENLLPKLDEKR
jgi:hypothetical protein